LVRPHGYIIPLDAKLVVVRQVDRRPVQWPTMSRILARTSTNSSYGIEPANRPSRSTEILRNCSHMATLRPLPVCTRTCTGQPRSVVVSGTTQVKPRLVSLLSVTTRTGLRPVCSRPWPGVEDSQ